MSSSTVHFASSPEVDAQVVPKPNPIRKSRPKPPAYGIYGPLVLGFAFSYDELDKRAFERLPEYRELSQQSPRPDHKMMIRSHNLIYSLCADIDHLWPQAFKGWVRDPDTGNGMYVVGLSSNRDSDRLRMPTPAHAEKMQKILKCGQAQWYPDLIPPSKTDSIASVCPVFKLYALI
ncbi:hypothetical protein C8J55DRAFT_561409 [Lentinula edodes]|uniref:Uncharacterized protein n=1 Tax=Lentinula lateritia TaxID=40482 RepID=A0A9W9DMZ8_9AGAR|nr:hypothetical protein C8J55DRAFT_561409 [Lentinula edodes]